MFKASKSLGFAALLIWISAILHMSTPAIAGFSEETFRLVPPALVLAVMGYLMLPNRRFMAWLTFYALLAAAIATLALSVGPSSIRHDWWMLLLAADLSAAFFVFVYLWYPKPVIRRAA
ncbi:hypothetical protein [Hoeflea olei]|uniref:Uncharacterized protein n=1 Tax=Hoeflea olei TaxID=1480615 RepID=A0A1C1YYF1_9HYPH|nr:hypothetical protein [Hoeflea olei]OCW58594.1 hypothetical protein AWJ14_05470 [Hoeflea olei]